MIRYADIKPRNLIVEYGILTVADIKYHDMPYIEKTTRHASKYFQIYH